MKKTTLALTLSTIITLSSSAQALELLVVDNYDLAGSPEIWKNIKSDQLPTQLLNQVSVAKPGSAYASIFPQTFFQEELFAVCHNSCNSKEIFREQNNEINPKDQKDLDVIEQSSVYYWLNKYFSYLNEKVYSPKKYLKVMTNRELRDETKGKKLNNNAFFNPSDVTLSFLPAKNSFLFSALSGRMNRSGFDPSVITHEASHYLFHHLFPNPVNDEIGGLNEGFADYMANIFLNNPKVGLVMMQGRTMRDSSKPLTDTGIIKIYGPAMEVHELGERVSYALWKSRLASHNKEELDRLVIDAVKDLSSDPYASVHDFKVKMLERLPHVIDSSKMEEINLTWETTFPADPNKLANLSFLNKEMNTQPIMGFKSRQVLPEKTAKEMGVKAIDESNFSILQMETINEKQIAILMGTEQDSKTIPYWVAIDAERANILGIYDEDKKLITDEKELERVRPLAAQAKNVSATVNDFKSKAIDFAALTQGKGTFGLAYKLKDKTSSPEVFTLNGTQLSGTKIRMSLKKKLLLGLILGSPEIETIDVYTLPLEVTSLPEVEGQRVIGYKIQFKTGTSSEVILDKLALQ